MAEGFSSQPPCWLVVQSWIPVPVKKKKYKKSFGSCMLCIRQGFKGSSCRYGNKVMPNIWQREELIHEQ